MALPDPATIDKSAVVLLVSPETYKELYHLLERIQGCKGQITVSPDGKGGVKLAFENERLLYGIFNGVLGAGYVPFRQEPNAPGL